MAHHAHDLANRGPGARPAPDDRPPRAQPIPMGFERPRGAAARRPHLLVAADAPRRPIALLHPGCYRIAIRAQRGVIDLHGVLRVDDHGDRTTVSGDLYRYVADSALRARPWLRGVVQPPAVPAPAMSALGSPVAPLGLPHHPPGRLAAYLRATAIRQRPAGGRAHRLAIRFEEYPYLRPAGGRRGAFAAVPRPVTLLLDPVPRPPGYTSICLAGTLHDGLVVRGAVALGWVTPPVDGLPERDAHPPAIAAAAAE
jgi:hypothetical protein